MQYPEIPSVKDIEEGVSKMKAEYAANKKEKQHTRLKGFLYLKDGEQEKNYVYDLYSLICTCTRLEKEEDTVTYVLELDNFHKKLIEGYAKFGGRKFQSLNRFTACICESTEQFYWFSNNSMPFVKRVKTTEGFFKLFLALVVGLILVTGFYQVQYKQRYETPPQLNKVLRLGAQN